MSRFLNSYWFSCQPARSSCCSIISLFLHLPLPFTSFTSALYFTINLTNLTHIYLLCQFFLTLSMLSQLLFSCSSSFLLLLLISFSSLFPSPLLSLSFPPFLFISLSFSDSPSLFFSPAVVGSKWVSDGCNPILQIWQKWWLGCFWSFGLRECVRV